MLIQEDVVINGKNGEITHEQRSQRTIKINTPACYWTLVDGIKGKLVGIKLLASLKILIELCAIAEFNTGIVKLDTIDRRTLCDKYHISNSTLSKCLKELADNELIIGNRTRYMINPSVFWKGENMKRSAAVMQFLKTYEI